MRISVFVSSPLRATLEALRGVDRDTRRQIRTATRTAARPIWDEEIRGQVSTPLESRVLGATARVAVSDQNVTLKSAGVGRSLSGGGTPADLAGGAEFGSRRFRQFRRRNRKGYVAHPAAAQAIPRLASLWVQTTIRTLHEAFERR